MASACVSTAAPSSSTTGSPTIRNGGEEWRLFPGHWRLPSRIVVLDADGALSFDVLAWLSAQAIPLIQMGGPYVAVGAERAYRCDNAAPLVEVPQPIIGRFQGCSKAIITCYRSWAPADLLSNIREYADWQ
jgi:hypothetical protein